MKIVVLGPSQSGKTCLAVGLAITSYGKALFKRAFVASPRGDASRDHLKELRKRLEGYEWPDATKDLRARTLDFEFRWERDKVEFSFDDYNGENVVKKEFRKKLEDLGEEDGVALLVNPGFNYSYVEVKEPTGICRFASDVEIANGKTESGFPVLTASAFDDSPLARKWLAEQEGIYEQLIKDLSTKNGGEKTGKPVVALTVTASDRLSSDLVEIRPRFESFLEKIKNRLVAENFKCKSFEVSITGALTDQAKPKLAGGVANTSAEPFLWLLRRLAWRIRLAIWIRRAILVSAVAAVIALCVGTYTWFAAVKADDDILDCETSCKNDIKKAEDKSTNARTDLANAIKHYNKLREHSGLKKQKAIDCANRLENRIWQVQKRLIKDKVRNIEESHGGQGDVADLNDVESLFALFMPSSPTNVTAKAYKALRTQWDTKTKPEFQEAYCIRLLREKVQTPLRAFEGKHGEAVIAKLYPLYDMIQSVESTTNKIALVKIDLASKLDSHVGKEWEVFAIPDFESGATTNATKENTRTFVALLEAWDPVTTNGIAVKSKLFVSVTNSVPEWRTTYEHSTFGSRIANAVRSGTLEDLAALYPQRVVQRGETNDYLTVAYVSQQYDQKVEGEFKKAQETFVQGLLNYIKDHALGKRPYFSDSARARIAQKARQVGNPFDEAAISHDIDEKVKAMAADWDFAKREECTSWVRYNVRPDRKRTGRNSLWDAYETFMRSNRDNNPFATNIVRLAVYQQAEKWFEEDVGKFKQLKSSNDDYANAVKNAFGPFKNLCRDVYRDKEPLKTSWAWHFACDCVDNGKIDSVSTCFPQRFEVKKVEGKIKYGDYRNTYKGTALLANIVFSPIEGNVERYNFVDFRINEKQDQNDRWVSVPFQLPSLEFHLFDSVDIRLEVNDQVMVGRNLLCKVDGSEFTGINLGKQNWASGGVVGGSFDLRKATKFDFTANHLTTKKPISFAYIRVYGTVHNGSIYDFIETAKKAAEQERTMTK